MLTRRDILAMIQEKGYFRLGPITLEYTGCAKAGMSPGNDNFASISRLEFTKDSVKYVFLAEVSSLSTPRSLVSTIQFISKTAESLDSSHPNEERQHFPLVVAPFLSQERLDDLVSQKVSGLDLCGNGVLVAGDLLVYKAGNRNLYPQSTRLRNVYQLKNSLAPRALLVNSVFQSAKGLIEFINARGGRTTFSTVSKVLKQLEEDLVISREAKSVRQIQPEKILDSLSTNYKPPKITSRWLGRCNASSLAELAAPLQQAAIAQGKRFVLTGASSANQYCAFGGEPIVSVYTDASIAPLLAATGLQFEEEKRFANLEIFQTFSDWVYFDPRDKDGLQIASPVQAYIEMAAGDPRQRQASEEIRRRILADLADRSESK
jgi:hypothetical protein